MTFAVVVSNAIGVINAVLIPGVFALAFLVFLWGIFRYVFARGEKEDIEKARKIMFWGVVVIAIMISIWGILRVFRNTVLYGTTSGSSYGVPYNGSSPGSYPPLPRPKPEVPPEPEGFVEWMFNCFGYCRSTDPSDPGTPGYNTPPG